MKTKIVSIMMIMVTIACGKIEEGKNFLLSSSKEVIKKEETTASVKGNTKKLGEITLLNRKTDSMSGEVRSFQSTKGFSSTVHVLSSKKGNILFDPGHYSEELSEYVDSIGGLDVILITHGHWDTCLR